MNTLIFEVTNIFITTIIVLITMLAGLILYKEILVGAILAALIIGVFVILGITFVVLSIKNSLSK